MACFLRTGLGVISGAPVRTALLIGATRGIGRAVACELARGGWRVVIVGRDRGAGEEVAGLAAARGAAGATFLECDVSLQACVRELAGRVRGLGWPLDLIVHSADVLRGRRVETGEGVELAFATNCLSRVLLNGLLLPVVGSGGAIMHVAAAGLPGKVAAADIPPPAGMGAVAAHNLGQRCNDVYGLALAERCAARGVRVMVMQPGMVATSIRRSGDAGRVLGALVAAAEALMRPVMTKPDDYARVLVALIERERGTMGRGVLFDRRFRPMATPARYRDPGLVGAVWGRLHEAVGLDPGAI